MTYTWFIQYGVCHESVHDHIHGIVYSVCNYCYLDARESDTHVLVFDYSNQLSVHRLS